MAAVIVVAFNLFFRAVAFLQEISRGYKRRFSLENIEPYCSISCPFLSLEVVEQMTKSIYLVQDRPGNQ